MKKISTIIALAFSLGANAQNIYTFAGNGTQGYTGDGGQATAAEIYRPADVALDAAGNMYIVDQANQSIRMVNSAGVITTLAGTGTSGYTGDGGQATAAQFSQPSGIAIDAAGNLYISDAYNQVIRKINSAGVITTFAGNNTAGDGYSGDGGQATAALLSGPNAIAIDAAGNLYIVDNGNNVIRVVNTAGIISTFAGNGTQGYTGDGGQATAASIYSPQGIAIDATGNIYIGDQINNVIRKVNSAGIISTFAGNGFGAGTATGGYSGDGGQATAAEIYRPADVALDAAGNMYIDDQANQRIRMVNSAGIITTIAGNGTVGYSGDGGPATAAQLYYPQGMVVNTVGNLYIADWVNNRVRVVSALLAVSVNSATICAGDSATLTASGATTYSWSPATGLSTTTGSTVVASPTVPTTYTVTGTTGINMGTATAVITVNPLPTVSVTVNTATVCAGTMDTLTASGTATSYTWSTTETTMSVTPSPTITSTYTVMGTDANNCINWATATINVNALPTLTITTSAGYSICPNALDTLKASGAISYTWSPGNHVVTDYTVHPNNTTTYTLTGVDANGCKSKLTQLITVYPRPTLTITPNVAPICAGGTAILSITTGSVSPTSYTWSTSATTSSISVSPVITTTYNVIGASAQGCVRTSHYTLTVNPLPTVTAASNMDTICINGTATLTAGGATTYSWNTSATGASIPVTLTVTTTYTVMGTDGNGCENMATVTQSVSTNCYEGIERYSNNDNVSIYPNPSNGNFVLTTTENTSSIMVTDILGNELVSINPKGNTTTNINLSAQPSGIYFIKVIANGAQTVKRIIINN